MIVSPSPKSAVILAAGFGSRLRPLTDLRPKPLVAVGGTPILFNALRHLEAVGVEDVTIVVGYRKDAIQYACGRRFGKLDINYVESSVYDATGNAYSLWLARHTLLKGDTYLLEGDVFFELDALRNLGAVNAENVAAVAPFDQSMEGPAVVLDNDGFISEVRTKQTAANLDADYPRLFKTINLIRFSGVDLRQTLVPHLDDLVGHGVVKFCIEELLGPPVWNRSLRIAAARCDEMKLFDIDNENDLSLAEAMFAPKREMAC